MPDVFISYSRKNKEFVQKVHAALAAQKRDIWVDWEDIPLTSDWWHEICTGIEAADSVVVVMTPDSMSSPYCAMEVDHAIKHGKRLVPLVREPSDEKTNYDALATRELSDNAKQVLGERQLLDLARQNWNMLSRHNWLYFKEDTEFDANFAQLVSALDTDLEHVKEHTRLLVRAREWQAKGKDASYLLSGTDIADAEKWIAQNVAKQPSPLPLHAEYIGESRKVANQRQRALLVGVSVALVISLALTILSFVLFRQAEASRDLASNNAATAVAAQSTAERRAEESSSILLGQRAEAVASNDPFLAYALALNAVGIVNPPPAAQQSLEEVANVDAVARFVGHQSYIRDVIFTPDSQSALSLSVDGVLIRWDVRTGQIIGAPDDSYAFFLAFSPDARYVALNGESLDSIIIRDLETGETVQTLSGGHSSIVNVAAFSPDGRYLISGDGYDGDEYVEAQRFKLIVWDLETGEAVHTVDGLESPVHEVDLSADGLYAAFMTMDAIYSDTSYHVSTWDLQTDEILWTQDFGYVRDIDLQPDRPSLWVNPDTGIQVLDVRDGGVYLSSELEGITNFSFYTEDQYVLFATSDDHLSLWSTVNLSSAHNYVGHPTSITTVAISPDGQWALSGDQDGGLILWDLNAFQEREFIDFKLPNLDAAMSVDTNTFVWVPPIGGIAYIAPAASGYWETGVVSALALSPDSEAVLVATDDGNVWYGIIETDLEVSLFADAGSVVRSLAFHPIGGTIVTGAEDGSVVLWDWETSEVVTRFAQAGSPVDAVAFNPDGTVIASGADDGSVMLWDVASGAIAHLLNGHSRAISSIAFSPDGMYVLSGDSGGTAILWDAETGELLHTFPSPGLVSAGEIAFSPDSLTVAVGYDSGLLIMWDLTDGTALRSYLGHTSAISAMTFTRIGIYSIGTDGTSFYHYNESLPQLINWFYDTRQVPELTCTQRLQYDVHPYCDDSGVVASATPYPTLTPIP